MELFVAMPLSDTFPLSHWAKIVQNVQKSCDLFWLFVTKRNGQYIDVSNIWIFAPKICLLRFAMKWLSYNIEILDVAISYPKVAWGLLYTLQISHLGTWDRNRDKKCCSFLSWHHHQMLQSHIFCLDALGQQLKNMLKNLSRLKTLWLRIDLHWN